MSTLLALRDLHLLHRRTSSVREQIERGPRQLEARQKHTAARSEELEKARGELKAIKVLAHQKETQRLGIETRVKDLQVKINTATSNKEYSALVAERDSNVMARGVLEDEILEILEREDAKKKEIQTAETELERLKAELAQLEQAVGSRGTELAVELASLEELLKTSEAGMPADMRDVYHRLVRGRGSDALASVDQGTCQGCFTSITPQMSNMLLMSELVICKSCGRILYLEKPPTRSEAE